MTKPTKEQIARAVEILRKEGIDTAEKFEALLAASRIRGSVHPMNDAEMATPLSFAASNGSFTCH